MVVASVVEAPSCYEGWGCVTRKPWNRQAEHLTVDICSYMHCSQVVYDNTYLHLLTPTFLLLVRGLPPYQCLSDAACCQACCTGLLTGVGHDPVRRVESKWLSFEPAFGSHLYSTACNSKPKQDIPVLGTSVAPTPNPHTKPPHKIYNPR
jgi:hypothetical protein